MMGVDSDSLKIGAIGAFIASLCCVGPFIVMLLLVTLGIGSASLALTVSSYSTHFMVLAFAFVAAAAYFRIKKRSGVCNPTTIWNNRIFIVTSIVVMAAVYLLILYMILPYLIGLVLR